ncbi:DUF3008 family protein [Paracoccus litorisediminis]|uniref:DUF3008 family protein n=1 Tax=Paracoccus litorisediminis TaxID=2006130 RepID=A0A844HWD1_9RHOB|nr:DUF3008 family protein [Paracoccus litorisediminis]MTH62627.1 DUF3008 family protein [Paracoccus litorisediminis]
MARRISRLFQNTAAALFAKRSETPKGNLRGAAKAMTEAQPEELASTKRKGKP